RGAGAFQPRKTDTPPEGAPIVDYYPRVVSDAEWQLARAGLEQRRGKDKLGRALVRSERKYVNLFRGMLTHARDGEGFLLGMRGRNGKPVLVLQNLAGHGGRAKNCIIPYLVFENASLEKLKEIDPRDVLPRADPAANKADTLRATLANVRQDIAGLTEELRGRFSKGLAAALREKEEQEE